MAIRVQHRTADIACVVIENEPKRNALDLDMLMALADLWPRLAGDGLLRAVILTGAGTQAFCSGADLTARLGTHPGIDDLIDRALLKTVFFPKPLIAAINGHCIAGGLELALSADIRIGGTLHKFGFPEVGVGVVPSGGGAMKLISQIGHAQAMDLLLTGRLIDGSDAACMGLITKAVDPAEVMNVAMERASMIAGNSPAAVAATKHLALACRFDEYRQREPKERDIIARVRATGHDEIGIDAFLSRRKPVFDDRSF